MFSSIIKQSKMFPTIWKQRIIDDEKWKYSFFIKVREQIKKIYQMILIFGGDF